MPPEHRGIDLPIKTVDDGVFGLADDVTDYAGVIGDAKYHGDQSVETALW